VSMYGGMVQVQFHLGNSQQGGIVIVSFHLRQCMVEWHKSHSTKALTSMALSSSLPL
jgi:hypothetical protein